MAHDGRKNADSLIAAALSLGATRKQAAERAGVSVRTVARRMRDETFCQRVTACRERLLQRTTGLAAGTLTRAVRTMQKLLDSKNDAVALRAAQSVIDATLRLHESDELGQRLRDTEALLKQIGNVKK